MVFFLDQIELLCPNKEAISEVFKGKDGRAEVCAPLPSCHSAYGAGLLILSQKCRMAMAPLIACMRLEGMLGGPGYEQIKPLRKILFPKEDK